MPGGATLYSIENTIIYDPFSGSKKHDDIIQIEISTQTEDLTQIENSTQEEDLTKIEDLNNKKKIIPLLNTHGVYVFDVVYIDLYRFE